jgi:hypothetical protein
MEKAGKMKQIFVFLTLLIVTSVSFAGAPKLYAADRTYLGELSDNPYAPDSTSNPYGKYGNPYSPNSINNPYGKYGSQYSPYSPNNPYAQ